MVADLHGFRQWILTEGASHVLFQRAGKCLQLEIRGMHNVSESVQLFAAVAVGAEELKPALGALEAFGCLCADLDLPREFEAQAPRNERLSLVLRALECWQSGLSQRQIAIELFGSARVEADWGQGTDYLKSQVRRLVKRGRWLSEGGYRALLR